MGITVSPVEGRSITCIGDISVTRRGDTKKTYIKEIIKDNTYKYRRSGSYRELPSLIGLICIAHSFERNNACEGVSVRYIAKSY